MMRRMLLAVTLGCGLWTARDAFAHDPEHEPDIRMLREAAAALKPSRPDLAQRLSEYADHEAEREEEEEGDEHHEDDEGPAERETR